MLLSRKEVFIPTEEQQRILGSMGYAAYKLWNVANYEKRNYRELGMEKFPDWYEQKKRLKENFFIRIFHPRLPRMYCSSCRKHGRVFLHCRGPEECKIPDRPDSGGKGWTSHF